MMLALARRVVLKHWAYACVGLGNLACILGIVLMPGDAVLFWAGLLGFFDASGLILVLALAPLLGDPDDVHRLSAAIFTISYPLAVLLSVAGGYAWDVSGVSWTAFAPIGACAIVLALLPFTIDFGRARI
jgi:CP family cyanate transporter-like MFS transporter